LGIKTFAKGRNFLMRVEYDSDFLDFLTDIARKQRLATAAFTAVGALKEAKLGFYDQERHVYMESLLAGPQEIASCVGNVSVKDEAPFVHAHVVLVDQSGVVRAGHLLAGRVFAAEVHLIELVGEKIERKTDAMTGLSLWDIYPS
jgi:predicted DNA-binding protein with PD1-like motif